MQCFVLAIVRFCELHFKWKKKYCKQQFEYSKYSIYVKYGYQVLSNVYWYNDILLLNLYEIEHSGKCVVQFEYMMRKNATAVASPICLKITDFVSGFFCISDASLYQCFLLPVLSRDLLDLFLFLLLPLKLGR